VARQQTATSDTPTQDQQQLAQQRRSRSLARSYDPFGLMLSPVDFFRANPFSLFRRMAAELDRMASSDVIGRGSEQRTWMPAIEVEQREGNYMIRAELPGLKPDDVKVEITDDAVVISGERKEERDVDRGGVHMTELRYGQFYRSIPLPDGAKPDQVKARFENGVLEVTVPAQEQQHGRRQIQVEGSSSTGKSSGSSGSGGSTGSGGSERAA
jgi:HSP20 family protein